MERKAHQMNFLTSFFHLPTTTGIATFFCLLPSLSFSAIAPTNEMATIQLSDAELQQFLNATANSDDVDNLSPSAFGQTVDKVQNRNGVPLKSSYVGIPDSSTFNDVPTLAMAQAGFAKGPVVSLSSYPSKQTYYTYDNQGNILPVIGVNGARSDKPIVSGKQRGDLVKVPMIIRLPDPKKEQENNEANIENSDSSATQESQPQPTYTPPTPAPAITPTAPKSSLASTIADVASIASAISSVISPKDKTPTPTPTPIAAPQPLPVSPQVAPSSIEDLPPAIINANGQAEDINSRRARGEYIKGKVKQEVDARLSSLVQEEVKKALAAQGGVQNAEQSVSNTGLQATPPITAPVVAQAPTPVSTVELPVINITTQ